MAKHIVPMLLDRIVEDLTDVCIEQVAFSDPTRLSEVKVGRFQEDPKKAPLRAAVQGGDLDDPNLMDGIVTLRDSQSSRVGFNIEPREIGGSEMWYRRGTIRLELYFILERYTEESSREYAYQILGRISQALPLIQVHDLTDDFGEHAIKIFHTQNSMYQSGGPPANYLWRGKLIWETLTERTWN